MSVTLINTFIVPAEQQEAFIQNWKQTTSHFKKTAGFIETHLHRNSGIGNATFSFINIAKWESAEAWKSTHDSYVPTEYSIPGVKGHPAIFDNIENVVNEEKRAAGSTAGCSPTGCQFFQGINKG
jgi:heme-degrading monooxygenase HmoA